jgi:hypothetical protein
MYVAANSAVFLTSPLAEKIHAFFGDKTFDP